MQTRRFLEPACARAAAVERSSDRIERLIQSQERLDLRWDQLAHRMTDGDFHYELALASGSDDVVASVLRARADLLRWRDCLPMEDTIGHSVTEHMAVIEAIADGDGDRAEQAMRTHIENSEGLFRLFLQRYVDDPEIVLAEGEAAVARSFDLGDASLNPPLAVDPRRSARAPRTR